MGVKETWVSWKECDQVDSQGLRGVSQRCGLEETVSDKRKRMQAQLCLTLCDPMECNPPGSSVLGIFQARILEKLAISSSRGSSPPGDGSHVSRISYIGKGGSLPLHHQGSPNIVIGRDTYKDR